MTNPAFLDAGFSFAVFFAVRSFVPSFPYPDKLRTTGIDPVRRIPQQFDKDIVNSL